VLDDKTALIGTLGERPEGLGFDRCGNDPAKFFVGRSTADFAARGAYGDAAQSEVAVLLLSERAAGSA
jgi:hypothetical protein